MKTINDWLENHPYRPMKESDLTLNRISKVAKRMNILPLPCVSILVAGTNGKGSTVACLEAIYLEHGYHTFASTSPTITCYNERLKIDGENASEELFCQAFEVIEEAKGGTYISWFEWSVLAILWIIKNNCPEPEKTIALLEIGLGGRLDAFNIVDPDLSIITSIGLDHKDILGDTREKIAIEKMGICREGVPAICGDLNPPSTLVQYAKDHHIDVTYVKDGHNFKIDNPTIVSSNVACSLLAAVKLAERFPVSFGRLDKIANKAQVPGRFERHGNMIFDVAHNPDSVVVLRNRLTDLECDGKRIAVFSMLSDKDIGDVLETMKDVIDEWHIAEINDTRAMPLANMKKSFNDLKIDSICHKSIGEAYNHVASNHSKNDQIIIFGSFHVIGEVKRLYKD